MGLIAKLFGAASKEELDGLHLDRTDWNWMVEETKDLPRLLKSLHFIIDETATLFFEGCNVRGELKSFIETHSIPEKEKIARGTVWPKQSVVHIPATKPIIDDLAELAKGISPLELAAHFHVYDHGEVIFEWYDAFTDPMYISNRVSENKVKDFAESIGMNYEKEGEPEH